MQRLQLNKRSLTEEWVPYYPASGAMQIELTGTVMWYWTTRQPDDGVYRTVAAFNREVLFNSRQQILDSEEVLCWIKGVSSGDIYEKITS